MCRFVIYKGTSPVQLSHVGPSFRHGFRSLTGRLDSFSPARVIRSSTKPLIVDCGLIVEDLSMATVLVLAGMTLYSMRNSVVSLAYLPR